MKAIGIISTAALTLMLGIAVPIYAQQEQHDQQQDPKDKPAQQEEKRAPQQEKQPQPQQEQKQQPHAQQQQQEQNKQQHAEQQQQDQDKQQQRVEQQKEQQDQNKQQNAQQQKQQDQNNQQKAQQQKQQDQNTQQQGGRAQPQRTSEQQRVEQTAWQQHSSQSWDSDHRNWQQRGGYHGYRIPENRYDGYFGSNHGFRIYGLPFLVVSGYPRFQYQGYWFSLVDPWPGYWANDWYDTDDVYVTYVNNGYYLFDQRYPNVAIAVSISM